MPGAALPAMRSKDPRGKSLIVMKHVRLGDHQASVCMEEAFWLALKQIAAAEGCSMARLIRRVDSERRERFQKIFRQQPVSSSSIIIAVDAVLSGPTSVRKSSQPWWKATWVNAPAVRRAHGLGAEWLPWCPYHWRASGYQQRLKCPGGTSTPGHFSVTGATPPAGRNQSLTMRELADREIELEATQCSA